MGASRGSRTSFAQHHLAGRQQSLRRVAFCRRCASLPSGGPRCRPRTWAAGRVRLRVPRTRDHGDLVAALVGVTQQGDDGAGHGGEAVARGHRPGRVDDENDQIAFSAFAISRRAGLRLPVRAGRERGRVRPVSARPRRPCRAGAGRSRVRRRDAQSGRFGSWRANVDPGHLRRHRGPPSAARASRGRWRRGARSRALAPPGPSGSVRAAVVRARHRRDHRLGDRPRRTAVVRATVFGTLGEVRALRARVVLGLHWRPDRPPARRRAAARDPRLVERIPPTTMRQRQFRRDPHVLLGDPTRRPRHAACAVAVRRPPGRRASRRRRTTRTAPRSAAARNCPARPRVKRSTRGRESFGHNS